MLDHKGAAQDLVAAQTQLADAQTKLRAADKLNEDWKVYGQTSQVNENYLKEQLAAGKGREQQALQTNQQAGVKHQTAIRIYQG